VLSTSFNPDYPLIRFGTGGLLSACSGDQPLRPHQHAHPAGWMGPCPTDHQGEGHVRAAVAGGRNRRRHKEILKARLVVDNSGGSDRMTLQCEIRDTPPAGLAQAIEESISAASPSCGAKVAFRSPASWENDGRVIEDAKKYE